MVVKMYDSFLFGYGLTLAISNKLSNSSLITIQQKQILYFDSFFQAFITSRNNEQLYRKFLRLFRIDENLYHLHDQMKNTLEARMEEILSYGVERWVGKNLFNPNKEVSSEEKMYIYLLYAYWAHLMHLEVLRLPGTKKVLRANAKKIRKVIGPTQNIFTTNFDTLLDKYFNPQHLHGIIQAPLTNVETIILKISPNKKDLEYSFLFGANGLEKEGRLKEIHKMRQDVYQLDFFYRSNLSLGHLLIYGLSFGKTEFISKEFLNAYPKYENDYSFRSVDGHILKTLNKKYQEGLLSKITISYYTPQDLEHLKYFLSMTDFISIVEFKHANDIIQM